MGLSLNRLVMLGVLAVFFFFSIFQLFFHKLMAIEKRVLLRINLFFNQQPVIYYLLILICWVVVIFPAYRFGKYEVIYSRLQPLLVLIVGISITFLLLLKIKIDKSSSFSLTYLHKKTLLFFLISCGIIWIFLITTRIGLDIDHDFWGGAATPILTLPLLVSLFFAFILPTKFSETEIGNKKINFILRIFPILLFFSAIIIWNIEPFTPHFFAPKVRPPNYEYYPYSDAQIYDITAQTLLNGEGYFNRGYVQRPLYGFMLFIFHKLVGQDYLNIVFFQTILYALFPVLMYFLGKKLFSPSVGIALVILTILRELTAFQASQWMEIVHSKLYMTDNWASFFALLITLLIIYWYFCTKENHLLLVLIGFVLGISLLMRINLLLLFIPIFIFVFFKAQKNIKTKFLRILILGLSTFVILLPWMVRNYYQTGEFGVEPQKFRMVIETRFNVQNDKNVEDPNSSKPSQMIMPENLKPNNSNSFFGRVFGILRFTTANFLHNEIHSLLIFPNSIFAESVKGVIENNAYIQETWTGNLNFRQLLAIIINVLIIGIGISISFRKFKWFGLFPLSIHLFYNLSNGLARVSGWRYVIVTDWVVIIYYLVGMIFLFSIIFQKFGWVNINTRDLIDSENASIVDKKPEKNRNGLLISSIIFVIFIAFGMVLSELLIDKKYSGEITKEEFINEIAMNDMDFDVNSLNKLLQDPDYVFIHSKAFYPRYYDPGEGEPAENIEWLRAKESGNLGFMIISPVVAGVTLELNKSPDHFQHNQEVYIIGKWITSNYGGKYLEAYILFLSEFTVLKSSYIDLY